MVKRESIKKVNSEGLGWGNAITDAERELSDAEQRVARLKVAIRTFRQNDAEGVPFPSADD